MQHDGQKIALVHDSLTQLGGAERVVDAFHGIYPKAPLFVLVFDRKLKPHYEGWTVVASPLQHLYVRVPRLQYMLPLIPLAMRFFDFSSFDAVLSSSSAFAKGIRLPKATVHVSYCHTPARFLWMDYREYVRDEAPLFLRPIARMILWWLRRWDYRAAQRVDFFIANSENTKAHIATYYKRDSAVIPPFVDTVFFYPTIPTEDYYFLAGRLHAHKRPDLVIEAFNRNGKPLRVAGSGRIVEQLKKTAKPNISFLGRVSDEDLRDLYSGAKAYIYPQEEDFGIMPLEAMACGTPTIAYGKGGALETVIDGKTGLFFHEQTSEAIIAAVEQFEKLTLSSEDLFDRAQEFSRDIFVRRITDFMEAHARRG